MTSTQLLVPNYLQMLSALLAWLRKTENEDILSAKLAADMFPLSTQVRFTCLQAYEGVAWLRGEEFPEVWHELLDEGRNGAHQPGSLDHARARITETIAYLETLSSGALDDGESKTIELKLPDGRTFEMTGDQYIRDWAIPKFYFHVMTAYSILRRKGVDIGKADYVQHAFVYLRLE